MRKSEVDEMFVLHHLDLGMDEDEIEDLMEDSSREQRSRWLKKNGYEEEVND